VLYTPLSKEQITEIMHLTIKKLENRLAERQIKVRLTPACEDFIIENGYDIAYGARPMKRFIQRSVETAIAKLLIREYVPEGSTLVADVKNEEVIVGISQNLIEE